jgi:hypothetical protein
MSNCKYTAGDGISIEMLYWYSQVHGLQHLRGFEALV